MFNKLNIKMNLKKSKVLLCSRSNNMKTTTTHLQGNREIEKVGEFTY